MMRKLFPLLTLLVMLAASASAEVYVGWEPPEEWAEKDCMRLVFIDTGRSDCILVENDGKAMLVDGGEGPHTKRIRQVLEAHGIDSLAAMLNSHPHNDHIQGLTELIKDGLMADVFYSAVPKDYHSSWQKSAVDALKRAGIPYALIEDGDELRLGGVTIRVMRCPIPNGPNDRSAVLQLAFGSSRALLPGDITCNAMMWLLENEPAEYLKGDILKIPHHGITWLPDEFYNAVSPSAVCATNTREKAFQGVMPARAAGDAVFFSEEGCVHAVTDGVDWFVWQDEDQW